MTITALFFYLYFKRPRWSKADQMKDSLMCKTTWLEPVPADCLESFDLRKGQIPAALNQKPPLNLLEGQERGSRFSQTNKYKSTHASLICKNHEQYWQIHGYRESSTRRQLFSIILSSISSSILCSTNRRWKHMPEDRLN